MSDLQPLSPAAIQGVNPAPPVGDIGTMGILPISSLAIDGAFQRRMNATSGRVIRAICASFDWSKFLPVIVVRDGPLYSIVDGQHRTIAALSIGITEVPCYILRCSPTEAAAAFVAINGCVTPIKPVDIWVAELAAGAPKALELQSVLEAAEVTIVRRANDLKRGQTAAIIVLRRAHDAYGPDLLTTILQCITQTGEGNPGMINGAVINGIGQAIKAKPHLLERPSDLFDLFDDIPIEELFERARRETSITKNPAQFIITREINKHLRDVAPAPAKPAQPAEGVHA